MQLATEEEEHVAAQAKGAALGGHGAQSRSPIAVPGTLFFGRQKAHSAAASTRKTMSASASDSSLSTAGAPRAGQVQVSSSRATASSGQRTNSISRSNGVRGSPAKRVAAKPGVFAEILDERPSVQNLDETSTIEDDFLRLWGSRGGTTPSSAPNTSRPPTVPSAGCRSSPSLLASTSRRPSSGSGRRHAAGSPQVTRARAELVVASPPPAEEMPANMRPRLEAPPPSPNPQTRCVLPLAELGLEDSPIGRVPPMPLGSSVFVQEEASPKSKVPPAVAEAHEDPDRCTGSSCPSPKVWISSPGQRMRAEVSSGDGASEVTVSCTVQTSISKPPSPSVVQHPAADISVSVVTTPRGSPVKAVSPKSPLAASTCSPVPGDRVVASASPTIRLTVEQFLSPECPPLPLGPLSPKTAQAWEPEQEAVATSDFTVNAVASVSTAPSSPARRKGRNKMTTKAGGGKAAGHQVHAEQSFASSALEASALEVTPRAMQPSPHRYPAANSVAVPFSPEAREAASCGDACEAQSSASACFSEGQDSFACELAHDQRGALYFEKAGPAPSDCSTTLLSTASSRGLDSQRAPDLLRKKASNSTGRRKAGTDSDRSFCTSVSARGLREERRGGSRGHNAWPQKSDKVGGDSFSRRAPHLCSRRRSADLGDSDSLDEASQTSFFSSSSERGTDAHSDEEWRSSRSRHTRGSEQHLRRVEQASRSATCLGRTAQTSSRRLHDSRSSRGSHSAARAGTTSHRAPVRGTRTSSSPRAECALCGRRARCLPDACFCVDCNARMNASGRNFHDEDVEASVVDSHRDVEDERNRRAGVYDAPSANWPPRSARSLRPVRSYTAEKSEPLSLASLQKTTCCVLCGNQFVCMLESESSVLCKACLG